VLEANREPTKPEDLRAAYESLQSVAHKLAETLYKAAGASGPGQGAEGQAQQPNAGGPAGGGESDDNVIDAEFEDKN
jgi:molecular chaperone DnaK